MSDRIASLINSPVALDIKTEEKTVQLKEGERRTVAILFADIQGFTKLSEKLDHETVRDLMDSIFKIFTQAIEKHGGYVDKYTGDEIMALFGAKVASEVDTQRAVFCALDILDKMSGINKQLPAKLNLNVQDAQLSIRIGMNTGVVTTGRIGKQREGDFTVYGDAVNIASRMESNAPPDRIMLSEATMKLAGDSFHYEDHGSISVKGKTDEISVFLVSGLNDTSSSNKKRFQTPYVGSMKALKDMKKLLEIATEQMHSDKESQFITIGIKGEAGMGKSRLVSEFLKRNQCNYIRAGASNIHLRPYFIFISLLKSCMDISEFDSKQDMESKLDDFYLSLKSILLETENIEFLKSQALIGFLIGLDLEDDRLASRGRELQTHIHISIRAFLQAVCTQSNLSGVPLIIILEDMHWLDGASMEAIKYLYETIGMARGKDTENSLEPFFILDYRPEFSLPDVISQNSRMEEIIQESLNEANCIEIVNYFLDKREQLPKTQVKLLLERSAGNPFFIEEWMQLILSQKVGDIDVDHVIFEMEIPESLNSIILSRVDHLEKGLKELLQKGAVLGKEFYLHLLKLIEKELGNNSDIQSMIDELHDSKFVYASDSKGEYYHFKHILTREVTYETILKSNRKIIHGVAGQMIESHFKERLENFYYDLATHFDLSGNIEKTIEYLEKAGQQAVSIYDNSQAVVFYNRLLELLSDEKKKMDIQFNIGRIFTLTGKWKESEALLQNIYDKATIMNDNKRIAEFSGALGHSLYLQGNFKSARCYYEEQRDISEKEEMLEEWAASLGLIGNLDIDEGHLDIAMECFKKQKKYYTDSKMKMELAPVYSNMATVYFRQGKIADASDYYNRQLKICNTYDMKHERTKSLGNLAIINMIQGNNDDALYIFQEVLNVNHEIGDQQAIAKSLGNIGLIHNRLQNYDNALDYFNQMLDLSIRIGDQQSKASAYCSIGIVYKHQCKYKEAIDSFNENLKILEVLKISSALANTYGNMAETYMETGNFSLAREFLDKTLVICRGQSDSRIEAQVLKLLAEIDIEEGKFDSAKKKIEIASAVFASINNFPELYRSELIKVEIQRNDKEYQAAMKSIDRAKEYAGKIGDSKNEFLCSFLLEVINYQSGTLDDLSKIERLKKDLPEEDEIKAVFYYELWKISSGKKKDQYASISLEIYERLNDTKPKYRYNQRIKELI